MIAKPKALIFDVFGTLVDWRGSIAREVTQILGDRVDPDAFARAWRARYQPSMELIRRGQRGFVRLDDLHRENLLYVLEQFGIEGLDNHTIDHLNAAWHRLEPWSDVQTGLALLKPSFFLSPCSNANTSLMIRLSRHAGFPWDSVLGAEPAQGYKPEAKVYLTAADWLGLAPEQVMMVAAHNDDLAAAKTCGFMTAFFPRPEEYGTKFEKDLAATGDWTFVAADTIDLAHQLGMPTCK